MDIYAINYIGRRDKKLSDLTLLFAFYPSSVFSPLVPKPKRHMGDIHPFTMASTPSVYFGKKANNIL